MKGEIKWEVDHNNCSANNFLLVGDYNGHRFAHVTSDGFFGLSLMFGKWSITRKFKILYPEEFKKK